MADELVVVLGGSVAGTLTRLENARLQLEYDEAYRERPDAIPLSLSMPIQVRAYADDRRRQNVTNYLWGLLPDNEAVLDRWARHYRVSASSASIRRTSARRSSAHRSARIAQARSRSVAQATSNA